MIALVAEQFMFPTLHYVLLLGNSSKRKKMHETCSILLPLSQKEGAFLAEVSKV
jgi:hypothetical protein